MKKGTLTVKELAAELRMSPKSIQRADTVESEKRANGGTSERRGVGWSGLSGCFVCLVAFFFSAIEPNEPNKPERRA